MSVHQWIRFAILDSQQPTSPLGFLFLKLLPPPCAVLLVEFKRHHYVAGCKMTVSLVEEIVPCIVVISNVYYMTLTLPSIMTFLQFSTR